LEANPKDTSALRIKAESSLNLGELQTAKSAANNLLQMDPNNFSAIKTLIQIMPQVKDSAAVRKTIQRSLPQWSPEQQIRVRPLIMPRRENRK
jgi:two-component SAPR family response regulator